MNELSLKLREAPGIILDGFRAIGVTVLIVAALVAVSSAIVAVGYLIVWGWDYLIVKIIVGLLAFLVVAYLGGLAWRDMEAHEKKPS